MFARGLRPDEAAFDIARAACDACAHGALGAQQVEMLRTRTRFARVAARSVMARSRTERYPLPSGVPDADFGGLDSHIRRRP